MSIAFGAFAGSASATTDLRAAIDPLIGIDYKYGGSTTSGFDCSGFTSYVFAKFGIDLPRRSVDQAAIGTKVAKDELRPGDLVFFNTNGKTISHAGIYLGNGKFAHASSSRGVAIGDMNDSYYSTRYVTARRILDQTKYEKIAVEAPAVEVSAVPAAPAADAADVARTTEASELAAEHGL
ncbi:MAG TPA: C40 family peptidase [Paenibacillus sp.]|nr:C40 family peptidase [Paenibacillus sp.]HZG83321.1 C40 family peptidase [Paenibacillus sp.]